MGSTVPLPEAVVNGLRLGLSKKCRTLMDCNYPFLYRSQAYLAALRAAASGLETARVVLAKARQRLERAR
jgi:hypothetical protein